MKLKINTGEKMTELFNKIKSMKKTTLAVIGIFVVIAIVNMLGYGG
jgi:flagellar biosynthesis/type III secretory pathway M-ring protein FliF/YscJ